MSSRAPSLPPELVDMIVQYLSDDKDTLGSSLVNALCSATRGSIFPPGGWLNCVMNFSPYPHLQTLFRGVVIYQPDENGLKSDGYAGISTYMTCLTSVLSLLPSLVSMQIIFLDTRSNNKDAIRFYLDLIQISGSSLLVELDLGFIVTVEHFHVTFKALEGTNIKRVTLFGILDEPVTVDAGGSVTRLHLPSLECICFAEGYVDLPNLTQCEIVLGDDPDELSAWRDVLLRGFPPLKLFKFEITDEYMAYQAEEFIEWWSSTFRALSDSKAAIHFTELTLTFTDPENDSALKAAWQSLDNSLSHPVFSTVRAIHFEKSDHKALITQTVYCIRPLQTQYGLPCLDLQDEVFFVSSR
ncbi:hypothetical protein BDZ89DRAFT_1126425 [Hymenopellis radicata]|nr:hypothetical protein BDZ89DRAFT_1126425 [Hymenopellis radicata]